jgi:hypothetical protein
MAAFTKSSISNEQEIRMKELHTFLKCVRGDDLDRLISLCEMSFDVETENGDANWGDALLKTMLTHITSGVSDWGITLFGTRIFLLKNKRAQGKAVFTSRKTSTVWDSDKHYKISFEISARPIQTCENCDKKGYDLKKCASCQGVRYCSTQCQKAHWKQHKELCKELSEGPCE